MVTYKADLLTPIQQAAYKIGDIDDLVQVCLTHIKNYHFNTVTLKLLPKCQNQIGTWPAIWMLPVSHSALTELDQFEIMAWGPHLNQVHTGLIKATTDTTTYPTNWYNVRQVHRRFATYGMVWDANNITMYYNGVKICSGPTPESMHQQMYLIIIWLSEENGYLMK